MLAALALLCACSRSGQESQSSERDPVVADALADPIMADPDLAAQARGDSALTGGEPPGGPVPAFKRGDGEIMAAKAQAERLVGSVIADPGPLAAGPARSRLAGAVSAAAVVQALGLASRDCAAKLAYSAAWAARLPPGFEPYPRGHVMLAGGSDEPACHLRMVRYVTPVGAADVIAFHAARLRSIAKRASLHHEGADGVIAGNGFAIHVRQREDGLSEVDLAIRLP